MNVDELKALTARVEALEQRDKQLTTSADEARLNPNQVELIQSALALLFLADDLLDNPEINNRVARLIGALEYVLPVFNNVAFDLYDDLRAELGETRDAQEGEAQA
jgi:hypothetical protein